MYSPHITAAEEAILITIDLKSITALDIRDISPSFLLKPFSDHRVIQEGCQVTKNVALDFTNRP